MPKMNGFEVLQAIRQINLSKLCYIPIIMLSTSNNPKDINRSYNLGCNAYIVKDRLIEELYDTLILHIESERQDSIHAPPAYGIDEIKSA